MLQKAKDFISDFESEKFGREDVISMLYLFGSKIKKEQEEEIEDWKACHEREIELMKGLNDRIADLEKKVKVLGQNLEDTEICNKALEKKVEQARNIIRDLISISIDWIQEGDKDYSYIEDAKQFIGVEK